MLVDQATELADELPVTTQCELGVDADLDRPESKLLETLALRLPAEVEPDAGENGTAPERERFGRARGGAPGVSGRGRLRCLAEERLEEPRVEDGVAEPDAVPAASSLERDAARDQGLPEPRHVCLEAVRRGRRGVVPPDLVDEPLEGNDLVRAAASKQRVVITAKAGIDNFTLAPLGPGALGFDSGSVDSCCFSSRSVIRYGQHVLVNDPRVTLTGKRGTLVLRFRIDWLDAGNGFRVGVSTWKVLRGTGAYKNVTGGGHGAQSWLPRGPVSFREEGFLASK